MSSVQWNHCEFQTVRKSLATVTQPTEGDAVLKSTLQCRMHTVQHQLAG